MQSCLLGRALHRSLPGTEILLCCFDVEQLTEIPRLLQQSALLLKPLRFVLNKLLLFFSIRKRKSGCSVSTSDRSATGVTKGVMRDQIKLAFISTSVTSQQQIPDTVCFQLALPPSTAAAQPGKKPSTQGSGNEVWVQLLTFQLHLLLLSTLKGFSLYNVNDVIYTCRNTHWNVLLCVSLVKVKHGRESLGLIFKCCRDPIKQILNKTTAVV